MDKDKLIGVSLVIGGIAGIVIYGLLLWNYTMVVLAITAFVGVAAILVIVAWIGWTMATTPPPPPIEIEATSEEKPSEGSKTDEAKSG